MDSFKVLDAIETTSFSLTAIPNPLLNGLIWDVDSHKICTLEWHIWEMAYQSFFILEWIWLHIRTLVIVVTHSDNMASPTQLQLHEESIKVSSFALSEVSIWYFVFKSASIDCLTVPFVKNIKLINMWIYKLSLQAIAVTFN